MFSLTMSFKGQKSGTVKKFFYKITTQTRLQNRALGTQKMDDTKMIPSNNKETKT